MATGGEKLISGYMAKGNGMKRWLMVVFAIIGWSAIMLQYYLMIENRVASVGETTVRFFSFFTVLTNVLVAAYFTAGVTRGKTKGGTLFSGPGALTAITVYILVVGLVYQLVLRPVWEPTGLQMIVDELLHSIIPICVLLFWYVYEDKSAIKWTQFSLWLVYPLVYLVYILIRGSISGFYPYPFVDVSNLGWQEVLMNAAFLLIVFLALSGLLVGVGKLLSKAKAA